jgi:UDP-GlcNAc:undecaprenyl-phosphate GlcNAc-1-phosphate transferase
MGWLLILVLCASFVLSCAGTWVLCVLGRRASLMDSQGAGAHEKQIRDVPNIGGIAIVCAIVVTVCTGLAAVWALSGWLPEQAWAEAYVPYLDGMREQTPTALIWICGVLVLHLLGVIDDRRALGAGVKLSVMLVVSALVVSLTDTRLLELLDGRVGGSWLSILLTTLWIVAVINAINFMDNMDGLAAGVVSLAGGLFLVAAVLGGQWFVALMLALIVGASSGFWVHNRPPARIFMGDGGSLALGFLLGLLTVRTTYYGAQTSGGWYALFMPLCVLAVPLYDMVSVTVIRVSQGKSPFVGDTQHFSHRLRARGLSEWRTLAVIGGCVVVTGLGGILLGQVGEWQALVIGVQTIVVLVILGVYEHASGRRNGS